MIEEQIPPYYIGEKLRVDTLEMFKNNGKYIAKEVFMGDECHILLYEKIYKHGFLKNKYVKGEHIATFEFEYTKTIRVYNKDYYDEIKNIGEQLKYKIIVKDWEGVV